VHLRDVDRKFLRRNWPCNNWGKVNQYNNQWFKKEENIFYMLEKVSRHYHQTLSVDRHFNLIDNEMMIAPLPLTIPHCHVPPPLPQSAACSFTSLRQSVRCFIFSFTITSMLRYCPHFLGVLIKVSQNVCTLIKQQTWYLDSGPTNSKSLDFHLGFLFSGCHLRKYWDSDAHLLHPTYFCLCQKLW
jgi:hypothetical protein